MSQRPTCQATSKSYVTDKPPPVCGKLATHHIPQDGPYVYRESDTHLCDVHADEAQNSGQRVFRRWRDPPSKP